MKIIGWMLIFINIWFELDIKWGDMNGQARALFNSVINDAKLMPLSSFKSNKFSKYNLFPHAHSLPPFFDTNLQSEGRIVKYLKGPEGPLRAFYYQLFKLGYQIDSAVDYSSIIKNIIFSPSLTSYSSSPTSGKQYNINQYKRIMAEYLKIMQAQVIPNAELTFSQYPIIDEAMLAILELIVEKMQPSSQSQSKENGVRKVRTEGVGCGSMENLTAMLKGLCDMFRINLEIFDNCFSFVQSDTFLYVENLQSCYLAFLSEMAEVESYEKTSESPSGMQKQKEQIMNGSYASHHQQTQSQAYKNIRLSAGNRGIRPKISTNLNRSLPGKNKYSSLNHSASKQHTSNILNKDYEIDDHEHQTPSSQPYLEYYGDANDNRYGRKEAYDQDEDQEDNLEKNVFQSHHSHSGNQGKVLDQLRLENQDMAMAAQQGQEDKLISQIEEGIRQIQELVKSKPIQSTHIINAEQNNNCLTGIQPQPQSSQQIPLLTQPEQKPQSEHLSKTQSKPNSSSNRPPQSSNENTVVQETKNLVKSQTQIQNFPKSLYDVHTDKSITEYNNSVIETKAEHCDITELAAISQYQLNNIGLVQPKDKESTPPQIKENKRKGLRVRDGHDQGDGEGARRKSQVKVNNVIYQYEFKSFKYKRTDLEPRTAGLSPLIVKEKKQDSAKVLIEKISESYSLTIKGIIEKPSDSSKLRLSHIETKIQPINPDFPPTNLPSITPNQNTNLHIAQTDVNFFVPKGKNTANGVQGKKVESRDRLRERQQSNSLHKVNGSEETLGTFYREFSNTKIMQAMIEPFKTKVRATRQKFKGIRSKNFIGFK